MENIIVRLFVRKDGGILTTRQMTMLESEFKQMSGLFDKMRQSKVPFDQNFLTIDNDKVTHIEKVI